jgi:hypothetical protein
MLSKDSLLGDNYSLKLDENSHIWLKNKYGIVRRFGANPSLKRLNTKELLLFLFTEQRGKNPAEINSVIAKSLQAKLFKTLKQEKNIEGYSLKKNNVLLINQIEQLKKQQDILEQKIGELQTGQTNLQTEQDRESRQLSELQKNLSELIGEKEKNRLLLEGISKQQASLGHMFQRELRKVTDQSRTNIFLRTFIFLIAAYLFVDNYKSIVPKIQQSSLFKKALFVFCMSSIIHPLLT